MSDQSKIEWLKGPDGRMGATINPIRARDPETGHVGWHCVKCATGCAHCYAEAQNVARRFNLGTGLPYAATSRAELFFDTKPLEQVARWRRPRPIFVQSMGDLFLDGVEDAWIDSVFAIASVCPQHTFILLTKRIQRAESYLADERVEEGWWDNMPGRDEWDQQARRDRMWGSLDDTFPLPNVYIGMSASTQPELDSGTPALLRLASAGWKTFLSLEPLCGAIVLPDDLLINYRVDVESHQVSEEAWEQVQVQTQNRPVSGVIVGGESGPHARPMHHDWVRSIRDQCAAAGVPFFFKQWGEFIPYEDSTPPFYQSQHGDFFDGHGLPDFQSDEDKRDWICTDDLDLFRRVGKRLAGRTLDGQEHNALPWADKLQTKGQVTP